MKSKFLKIIVIIDIICNILLAYTIIFYEKYEYIGALFLLIILILLFVLFYNIIISLMNKQYNYMLILIILFVLNLLIVIFSENLYYKIYSDRYIRILLNEKISNYKIIKNKKIENGEYEYFFIINNDKTKIYTAKFDYGSCMIKAGCKPSLETDYSDNNY